MYDRNDVVTLLERNFHYMYSTYWISPTNRTSRETRIEKVRNKGKSV